MTCAADGEGIVTPRYSSRIVLEELGYPAGVRMSCDVPCDVRDSATSIECWDGLRAVPPQKAAHSKLRAPLSLKDRQLDVHDVLNQLHQVVQDAAWACLPGVDSGAHVLCKVVREAYDIVTGSTGWLTAWPTAHQLSAAAYLTRLAALQPEVVVRGVLLQQGDEGFAEAKVAVSAASQVLSRMLASSFVSTPTHAATDQLLVQQVPAEAAGPASWLGGLLNKHAAAKEVAAGQLAALQAVVGLFMSRSQAQPQLAVSQGGVPWLRDTPTYTLVVESAATEYYRLPRPAGVPALGVRRVMDLRSQPGGAAVLQALHLIVEPLALGKELAPGQLQTLADELQKLLLSVGPRAHGLALLPCLAPTAVTGAHVCGRAGSYTLAAPLWPVNAAMTERVAAGFGAVAARCEVQRQQRRERCAVAARAASQSVARCSAGRKCPCCIRQAAADQLTPHQAAKGTLVTPAGEHPGVVRLGAWAVRRAAVAAVAAAVAAVTAV